LNVVNVHLHFTGRSAVANAWRDIIKVPMLALSLVRRAGGFAIILAARVTDGGTIVSA
jgi:hypothetical protein